MGRKNNLRKRKSKKHCWPWRNWEFKGCFPRGRKSICHSLQGVENHWALKKKSSWTTKRRKGKLLALYNRTPLEEVGSVITGLGPERGKTVAHIGKSIGILIEEGEMRKGKCGGKKIAV